MIRAGGKRPRKQDYRTLKMKNYFKNTLPPAPAHYDALSTVYSKLHITDPTVLFPMDGNDQYGDCTIAALAHAITVYRGIIGQKNIVPKSVVTKLYFHLTGGFDSGLYVLDVMNYWRKNTVAGDKILAFASVSTKNKDHIKQSIKMFGGVYLGFQCQENVVEQFNAREPWTAGPLTQDGHAVYATGYDETGVTVLTWGNTQKATWEWWDECVDEAYVILPPEARSPSFNPGFNFTQLQQDLNLVAN